MMKFLKAILKRFKANEAGFTLAELLVVVGIIVGLAAVILPNVGRFAGEGTKGASATEISSVQTAIDAFASDTSTDILVQASTLQVLTTGSITSLGNSNLNGYLRLPNGATMTTDCYTWDTFGTVSQTLAAGC